MALGWNHVIIYYSSFQTSLAFYLMYHCHYLLNIQSWDGHIPPPAVELFWGLPRKTEWQSQRADTHTWRLPISKTNDQNIQGHKWQVRQLTHKWRKSSSPGCLYGKEYLPTFSGLALIPILPLGAEDNCTSQTKYCSVRNNAIIESPP